MTSCKKAFIISELFEDDLAKVATLIKMFGSKEKHSYILHRLLRHGTDSTDMLHKVAIEIDAVYNLIQDNYNIDGIVALVDTIHKMIDHSDDTTFNEEEQELKARLSLFDGVE